MPDASQLGAGFARLPPAILKSTRPGSGVTHVPRHLVIDVSRRVGPRAPTAARRPPHEWSLRSRRHDPWIARSTDLSNNSGGPRAGWTTDASADSPSHSRIERTTVPADTEIWFQFVVQDASSIHGLTLAHGLLATTP
jgi:hypothetical protein